MTTDHNQIIYTNKDVPSSNGISLRVFRANRAQSKDAHHYDTFKVPVQRWTTVLDALLYAKDYSDPSIAIRYSCRMAACGSCGMMINGIPKLACYTKVTDLKSDVITCEPLSNFPLIRDLVTDFSQFFDHHREMKPYIIDDISKKEGHYRKTDENIHDFGGLSELRQSPEDLEKFLQFSYCIKCGLCYAACPTNAEDTKYPGPQALSAAYRYFIDSRDKGSKERLTIVDTRHGIWRCHFAGSCSHVCPKGVDPALGIALLKGYLLGYSKK
jgi:succinate dehydrogenase iron-sulfur subunit